MTAFTYSELVQKMKDYFEDSDPEFTTQIPDLIAQGEARVYGDLALDTLNEESPATLTPTSVEVTKPANCISIQEVRRSDGTLLLERTVAFVNAVNASLYLPPTYWAETTPTQFRVAPKRPDGISADETLTVRHSAPEEQLSSTQTTTWVSTIFGDLLLASCLLAGETFNKNTAGEQARSAVYTSFLKQAQAYLMGRQRVTTRS